MRITDTNDPAYEELFERLAEMWRGWERGAEQGLAFYADDPESRIWDGTPVPEHGKAAYAREVTPGRDEVSELKIEGGDLQVWREGDLAVTTAVLHNVGKTTGWDSFEETMRETMVWAPDADGRWRIVHEHTSLLPEYEGSSEQGGP